MAFVLLLLALPLLTGCGGDAGNATRPEAERMMDAVSSERDYNRLLALADSLEKTGDLSEADSYFWQGFAYYRMMQRRTAEFCWKESINAVENADDAASLTTYTRSVSYLAGLYIRYLNFSSALKMLKPALTRLDKHGFTASGDYTNLLIFEGCCQAHFNAKDSLVNELFEKAYHRHLDHIGAEHSKEAYRNAVVGFINITYGWLSEKRYDQGLMWNDRLGRLLEDYKQRYADDEAYIDKQWARYKIFMAIGLEGLGRQVEAAEAFAEYQQTHFANSLEGKLDASDYLSMSGNWKEAADNLHHLDEVFVKEQVVFSMEEIQKFLLKKYHVNAMAGFVDTANAVANQICQRLDSAIIRSQLEDAEEQETIRMKEEQILHQQERLSRGRMIGLAAAFILISISFTIYTIVRQRAQRRLSRAHEELKTAYGQLEEATTVKERMESELRIARDIQMSMVPTVTPDYEGLDIFASMMPAREVGGDLYGYLLSNHQLYFCIGDVSGKGVPASLFMAQAIRLFHALATQDMSPAMIATSMNAELAENNEQSMFVTMIICRLNLKLKLLEYCNAGHNPPVIGNEDGQFSFLDMEPNAPIGLWPGLEYQGETIEYFNDRLLLLYTDGLNEAEDPKQEQFGEERIIKILSAMPSSTTHDIVEALQSEVKHFRNGAEPNDDLTMLCLKMMK
ncbi:MAG: serine/threonine-protein phosphatase [Prevotella sp.]|nr:serine/threonine-protein phosphatase [Prevotella sp.]